MIKFRIRVFGKVTLLGRILRCFVLVVFLMFFSFCAIEGEGQQGREEDPQAGIQKVP